MKHELLKLAKKFQAILSESDKDFRKQTFSDKKGEYLVSDISEYAGANCPETSFDIDDLADIAFEKSSEESGDEVPGSPEFIERAMKADLSYPIVVIRYSDGDFIADGVHRLWKARAEGHVKIQGFLMQEADLEEIPKV